MTDFDRSRGQYEDEDPVDYDEDPGGKRKKPGTWFGDLGDRLARGFATADPAKSRDADPAKSRNQWEPADEPEQPTAAAEAVPWESPRKRFPTALHGYDRTAVDEHIEDLERELEELRGRHARMPTVTAEIERVGEETSAILRVAHEQAAEITRRAQQQADRCVADAAANAVAMTQDAKRNLSQLDTETDAVWAERGRLIEDIRTVATALFSLAEDAAEKFPEAAGPSTDESTAAPDESVHRADPTRSSPVASMPPPLTPHVADEPSEHRAD